MNTILLAFLLVPAPAQAPELPVAVLRSGRRLQCLAETRPGARLVATPFGRLDVPDDPVLRVEDGSREVALLRSVREQDPAAWARHLAGRGLLEELVAGTRALVAADPAADHQAVLAVLEELGRDLDPVPAGVEALDRPRWLWDRLTRADAATGALLSGRLGRLVETWPAGARPPVGLVALRRALEGRNPVLARAAARVAAARQERDLLRSLFAASVRQAPADLRRPAAVALTTVDADAALGAWSLALWRAREEAVRARAAENLGRLGDPRAVASLIRSLQAADAARAPGATVSVLRQISLVTDFDVEIAQAAAIADPVVSVVQEGVTLEARVLSIQTWRSVDGALRRLTGADPGPRPGDWLRWWEARQRTEAAGAGMRP